MQHVKVQNKISKIIEAIETLERISLTTNIWRVFCFFDKGRIVILLNRFTTKTRKTPTTKPTPISL
jgi:phage-related protein